MFWFGWLVGWFCPQWKLVESIEGINKFQSAESCPELLVKMKPDEHLDLLAETCGLLHFKCTL